LLKQIPNFITYQIKSNIVEKMFRCNFAAGIVLLAILSLSALAAFNLDGSELDVSAASTNPELWSFTATNHTNYNATFYWSVTTIEDRVYAVENERYKIPGENHPLLPYGRTISTLYVFTSDGTKLWDFSTFPIGNPTVVDETVYVTAMSSDFSNVNKIYAFDADSGSQKWTLSVPGNIAWYTSAGNIVYVGVAHIVTGEGYFIYAVNATTGQQVWRQTFHWGDDYPENVIVDNGVIYFAHSARSNPEGGYIYDDEFFAINATDGSTIWRVHLNGGVFGPTALISGLICFSTSGPVCALNATNGEIAWSTPCEQGYFFSPDFGSSGGIVFAVGYQEYENTMEANNGYPKVYALNALNGRVLWSYATKGHSVNSIRGPYSLYSLDIEGKTLYLMMDYSSLYAVNATNGWELWSHSRRPFVIDGGVVYFYAYDNNLEAVDASQGTSLWNCTTSAEFVSAQNNVEYFSVGTTIYALSINANSAFEPTPIVSPSPSSNPATPNQTAMNPTSTPHVTDSPAQTPNASPTPITPELPGWVILPIAPMIFVIAVAILKRRK
jgi:outer membrane protein assembly factor BamB